jgi:phosphoribosylamine--glycine ligase
LTSPETERPNLVIVGPEVPLVMGLADKLRAIDIPVFGPSARAAMLEGSKGFSKDFMAKHNIPTARYRRFDTTQAAEAKAYLDTFDGPPYVLKADGLAAGKGVVIPETKAEAEAEIDAMLGGKFGAASASLVIEEFMHGEEASFFALCDGETAVRSPAPRTTSASAMATPAPTLAAWAPTRPPPSSTPPCSSASWTRSSRPPSKA